MASATAHYLRAKICGLPSRKGDLPWLIKRTEVGRSRAIRIPNKQSKNKERRSKEKDNVPSRTSGAIKRRIQTIKSAGRQTSSVRRGSEDGRRRHVQRLESLHIAKPAVPYSLSAQ